MHSKLIKSMPDKHLDMCIKGTEATLNDLLAEKERRHVAQVKKECAKEEKPLTY